MSTLLPPPPQLQAEENYLARLEARLARIHKKKNSAICTSFGKKEVLQLTSFESERARVLPSENTSTIATAATDAADPNESVSLLDNRRRSPHAHTWRCYLCCCCRYFCGPDHTDDDSDDGTDGSEYEIDEDAYFTPAKNMDSTPS